MKAKGWPVCVPVLTRGDCRSPVELSRWISAVFMLCDVSRRVVWDIVAQLGDHPEHVRFNTAMRSIGYVVVTWVKDADGKDFDPWGVR